MSNVSVVISSCDRYSDCWGPRAHGLDKYWPDCPYPIYLVTNSREFHHPRIQAIKTTETMDWGDRMVLALDRIGSPHMLYLQEDYWIEQRVETDTIRQYVELLGDGSAYNIGLWPFRTFGWDLFQFSRDTRLGVVGPSASYRTTLQAALWDTRTFRELLRPEESLWDFENLGSERSRAYKDKFLCVRKEPGNACRNGIKYTFTAVNGGRWSPEGRRYIHREGLDFDFSSRPNEKWSNVVARSRLGRLSRLFWYAAKLFVNDSGRFFRKLGERGAAFQRTRWSGH